MTEPEHTTTDETAAEAAPAEDAGTAAEAQAKGDAAAEANE